MALGGDRLSDYYQMVAAPLARNHSRLADAQLGIDVTWDLPKSPYGSEVMITIALPCFGDASTDSPSLLGVVAVDLVRTSPAHTHTPTHGTYGTRTPTHTHAYTHTKLHKRARMRARAPAYAHTYSNEKHLGVHVFCKIVQIFLTCCKHTSVVGGTETGIYEQRGMQREPALYCLRARAALSTLCNGVGLSETRRCYCCWPCLVTVSGQTRPRAAGWFVRAESTLSLGKEGRELDMNVTWITALAQAQQQQDTVSPVVFCPYPSPCFPAPCVSAGISSLLSTVWAGVRRTLDLSTCSRVRSGSDSVQSL